MQSMKESAANVAASAKSGMEKTKAVVQEKVEKMSAHSTTEKEMAADKKHERIHQAELNKVQAREQNAAAKQAGGGSHSFTATGPPMGAHQMSAMPGHATGAPNAPVTEGTVESRPIGTATGTAPLSMEAQNTHAGGGCMNTGHATGGGYSG